MVAGRAAPYLHKGGESLLHRGGRREQGWLRNEEFFFRRACGGAWQDCGARRQLVSRRQLASSRQYMFVGIGAGVTGSKNIFFGLPWNGASKLGVWKRAIYFPQQLSPPLTLGLSFGEWTLISGEPPSSRPLDCQGCLAAFRDYARKCQPPNGLVVLSWIPAGDLQ